jgi:hypothetical protein
MMDTIDNRPQDEGESRSDSRLVEELESLYHEVARLDQAYVSEEGAGDLYPGQRIQELRPAVAISGLDTAVETTGRCSDHHPPCREELMERLNKVRGAYEKMLTYWPYASEDSPVADI